MFCSPLHSNKKEREESHEWKPYIIYLVGKGKTTELFQAGSIIARSCPMGAGCTSVYGVCSGRYLKKNIPDESEGEIAIHISPDVITIHSNPDVNTMHTSSDGITILTSSDVITMHTSPGRITILTSPNGITIHTNPDGITILTSPDVIIIHTSPQGSPVEPTSEPCADCLSLDSCRIREHLPGGKQQLRLRKSFSPGCPHSLK